MATYERRVLEIQRVEFHVPAPPPWGATWVEVSKAVRAAIAELVSSGRLAEHTEPADDIISVTPLDDAIVISYEVRSSGPVGA